ncbi:MAG: aminodeoxychorismate/anthranilate synthase component II [Saprospiraceae bacterium]
MKILVLDNYDSFTYNLVQYVQELIGHKVDVFRNDAITLDEVDAYDKIILSPGPGLPKDAGIMPELIKRYAPTKDILGVCLGHQAIGEAFGGTLHNIEKVYHGVATPMEVTDGNALLFRGLPNNIEVGRYHSWIVERPNLPESLQITAVDEHGAIMAMKHRKYNVRGVQFHPESVLTPMGKAMLRNFLFPNEVHTINYTEDLIAEGKGMA